MEVFFGFPFEFFRFSNFLCMCTIHNAHLWKRVKAGIWDTAPWIQTLQTLTSQRWDHKIKFKNPINELEQFKDYWI